MQVLLLDDDTERHEDFMIEFMRSGFHVMATSSFRVAETILAEGYIDLFIAGEEVQGRLTHNTALYGEHRNPSLSTILISDRSPEDVEDLFDLIPSVHCIVGGRVSGRTVIQLGRASVASQARSLSFNRRAPLAEDAFTDPRSIPQTMSVAA